MTAPAAPELVKPRLRGVSHRYAFFVSIVAAVVIVAIAPSGLATFGAVIYGVTMVGMFGASALYHGPNWSAQRAPRFLQLDHTAIFLFIAGTATPILLLTSDGATRAIVLGLVWSIAIGGVLFEWLPIPRAAGLRDRRCTSSSDGSACWRSAACGTTRESRVLRSSPAAESSTPRERSSTRLGARIRGRACSATTRSSTSS